jgi:threonine aldolase
VLCHEHAHIRTDETGAPGFFGQGVGLITLPRRLRQDRPRRAPSRAGAAGRLAPPVAAALSLTNATEYGTVYTDDELRRLIELADA